jgi:hypothetical protein
MCYKIREGTSDVQIASYTSVSLKLVLFSYLEVAVRVLYHCFSVLHARSGKVDPKTLPQATRTIWGRIIREVLVRFMDSVVSDGIITSVLTARWNTLRAMSTATEEGDMLPYLNISELEEYGGLLVTALGDVSLGAGVLLTVDEAHEVKEQLGILNTLFISEHMVSDCTSTIDDAGVAQEPSPATPAVRDAFYALVCVLEQLTCAVTGHGGASMHAYVTGASLPIKHNITDMRPSRRMSPRSFAPTYKLNVSDMLLLLGTYFPLQIDSESEEDSPPPRGPVTTLHVTTQMRAALEEFRGRPLFFIDGVLKPLFQRVVSRAWLSHLTAGEWQTQLQE